MCEITMCQITMSELFLMREPQHHNPINQSCHQALAAYKARAFHPAKALCKPSALIITQTNSPRCQLRGLWRLRSSFSFLVPWPRCVTMSGPEVFLLPWHLPACQRRDLRECQLTKIDMYYSLIFALAKSQTNRNVIFARANSQK